MLNKPYYRIRINRSIYGTLKKGDENRKEKPVIDIFHRHFDVEKPSHIYKIRSHK